MRRSLSTIIAICLLVFSFSGYAQPPSESAAVTRQAPSPIIPPAFPHCVPAALVMLDHVVTSRYKITIRYPSLSACDAPLSRALNETGERAKQEFMQALPDPKQFPEFADRQLQLLIDFKIVARANDFISVREQGVSDTGGAHPLPIDASFVYDARARRVIASDDLFADPAAARKRLAEFARAALMKKNDGASTQAQ